MFTTYTENLAVGGFKSRNVRNVKLVFLIKCSDKIFRRIIIIFKWNHFLKKITSGYALAM